MKRLILISAVVMSLVLFGLGLALSIDPVSYHFREFENIRTNFNAYRPSFSDRLKGIGNNQEKWEYHLESLVEHGAVRYERFVLTNVLYTHDAGERIWLSASSNFPNAIMVTAPYYATNAAGYGVDPYVLEVWDVPGEMQRWSAFVEAQNRKE